LSHLLPGQVRQHQVEHHQVGVPGPGRLERGLATARLQDVITVALQVQRHRFADLALVVDDQHCAL